jgi:4'-phosphopantetheinyl transferase
MWYDQAAVQSCDGAAGLLCGALRLEEDEVGLFLLRDAHIPDAVIATCERWLSGEELQRLERIRFPEQRREYLLGKALTRAVLAAFCFLRPEQVAITKCRDGKPILERCDVLDFNLSHTKGVTLLAVTRAGIVGVDIENRRRRPGDLMLARRHFAQTEYQDLQQLNAADGATALVALWTLKESLLKAIGCGLTVPLSLCRFRVHGRKIDIEVNDNLKASGKDWHCQLFELGDGLICAWAAAVHPSRPLRSRWFEWLPSRGWTPLSLSARAAGRTRCYGGPPSVSLKH